MVTCNRSIARNPAKSNDSCRNILDEPKSDPIMTEIESVRKMLRERLPAESYEETDDHLFRVREGVDEEANISLIKTLTKAATEMSFVANMSIAQLALKLKKLPHGENVAYYEKMLGRQGYKRLCDLRTVGKAWPEHMLSPNMRVWTYYKDTTYGLTHEHRLFLKSQWDVGRMMAREDLDKFIEENSDQKPVRNSKFGQHCALIKEIEDLEYQQKRPRMVLRLLGKYRNELWGMSLKAQRETADEQLGPNNGKENFDYYGKENFFRPAKSKFFPGEFSRQAGEHETGRGEMLAEDDRLADLVYDDGTEVDE